MPLRLIQAPLLQADQDKLTVLLNSPAFVTLKNVIEAKALELEIQCMNHIGESAVYDKYNQAALDSKAKAAEFRTALHIIQEISKSPTHTTIHQITTTPL